jgi:hypothetical protein
MAGEDARYLEWVRTLPCCRCARPPRSHPHHKTVPGIARKAHDHDAMPLCPLCHHDFHALCGPFKGWTRDQLRLWQELHVGTTQARSWLHEDADIF